MAVSARPFKIFLDVSTVFSFIGLYSNPKSEKTFLKKAKNSHSKLLSIVASLGEILDLLIILLAILFNSFL